MPENYYLLNIHSLPFRYRLLVGLLKFFFALLYHQLAWTYDLVAATVSLGLWNKWVLTSLPYLTDDPVLEIGHGPGHLQAKLLTQGRFCLGLDASPQMSRLAQRRLRKLNLPPRLVRGLAQNLPFPKGTFQNIVATFPAEFIFDPNTLSEIFRLLKPGGKAVIIPFAWITGKNLVERAMAWLFRVTGEVPDRQEIALAPLRQAGFIPTMELLPVGHSKVLIVQAIKPPQPA